MKLKQETSRTNSNSNLKTSALNSQQNIQNQMNQQDAPYDYMSKNSSLLSKMLGLQYLNILKTYWEGVTDQNLIRYRPKYGKMLQNQYLWNRFLKDKEKFSVLKEIFSAQKGPFIFIFIMSILMGIVSLFGAYCQRFLFYEYTEEDYHTSGWVFFSVIMAAAVVRFFIFNYMQTLANELAVNVRIHLQNSYIRCVLNLPKNKQTDQNSLLYYNYFGSVQVIMLAIKTLPFFVSSAVIVFGIVGFVIHIVGEYGLIVLGVSVLALIIQLVLIYFMFHCHERYAKIANKRNEMSIFSTSFLINMVQNSLGSRYSRKIRDYRKKQTSINFKYTLFDGFIEVVAETVALLTIFLFYVIQEYRGQPSYKEIFQCVVLFSVFKTPVKIMTYGMAFAMQFYGGAHSLQEMFDNCKTNEQSEPKKVFPRYYPHYSKFWQRQEFYSSQEKKPEQIKLRTLHPYKKYEGMIVMIVNNFDSNVSCDDYIKKIVKSLPGEVTFALLQHDAFVVKDSVKQNILLGAEYDLSKFQAACQVAGLSESFHKLSDSFETIVDENQFRTNHPQILFQIELARVIYNEIDILLINHSLIERYLSLLKRLKQYIRNKKQIIFVTNLSGSHLDLSDQIIVLQKSQLFQQGSYKQLIKDSTTLKKLETQFLEHKEQSFGYLSQLTSQQGENQQPTHSQIIKEVGISYQNIFKFYNFNHFGAGIVLLIFLCVPPLVDLYMQIVAAQSKQFFNTEDTHSQQDIHVEEHRVTVRYGISLGIFFVMNIIKVIILSKYLQNSAYRIFSNLMKGFFYSNLEKTSLTYDLMNGLDLERNLQSMDVRTTTEIDICMTSAFEHVYIVVFAIISSLLFLAVGIPFIIINIGIVVVMVVYSRKLFSSRRSIRSQINEYVKQIITHRQQIKGLHKDKQIFKRYVELNKKDIIYQLNEDWLMQGLSILLEFIIILMLMTVMIITLTKFHSLHEHNESFLQLSISFLIGLVNGIRLDLKIFKAVDRQVNGISSLFQMINYYDQHQRSFKNLPGQTIQSIQFNDFSVNSENDFLAQLNLTLQKGDRVMFLGSRNSGKRTAYLALFRFFQKQHVKGQLLINNLDIYQEKISRKSLEKSIHVIPSTMLFEFGSTPLSYIQQVYPDESQEKISTNLQRIWHVMDVEPLFTINDDLQTLPTAHLNIFFLLVSLSVLFSLNQSKASVLIIENSFQQIDSITFEKIINWLIIESGEKILIDLTNRPQCSKLYKRHLHFEGGKVTRLYKQGQFMNEKLIKRVENKKRTAYF